MSKRKTYTGEIKQMVKIIEDIINNHLSLCAAEKNMSSPIPLYQDGKKYMKKA